MAFVKNPHQQISLTDPFFGLTDREQRYLKESWAEHFGNLVFSAIDEEPFRVLYSDNPASRPNTPVNVLLGALILREIFGLSDQELQERMLFDILFQYALRTSSFDEQPVSDRSFSRFREKVYNHYRQSGDDLIQAAIEKLTPALEAFGETVQHRMMPDAKTVALRCRRISQLEMLESAVRDLAARLEAEDIEVPSGTTGGLHWLRSAQMIEDRLTLLREQAKTLVELTPAALVESGEYRLLWRLFEEIEQA